MFDTHNVGVFLGLDIGKTAHHGHGLTPAGKTAFDKQLPNSEPRTGGSVRQTGREVRHGPGDRGPARFRRCLPLAVARDAGCKVAYLPGLAMRRIAESRASDAAVA